MQLMVARMRVPYPKDVALIRLQARESHLLELVHQPLFLFWRYRVVWMPGKNASGEAPFVVQRVNEVAGGSHISAQYFRRSLIPPRIIRTHKVVRGAVTAALAMREHFHIHGGSPSVGGGGVSLNSRSRLTKATSTSMTSARLLWMFTHRAS